MKGKRALQFILLAMLAGLLAVACTSGGDPTGEPVSPEPDSAPETGDTTPDEEATEPAVSLGEPDFGATAAPTTQADEEAVVVMVAQQVLANQVRVAPGEIGVVDVEQVEWENTCLGLNIEAELCDGTKTPGYRVTLEVNGEEYGIHTDRYGQSVALGSAPPVSIDNPAMTWTSVDIPCQQATLGAEGVIYGLCEGAALKAGFPTEQRAAEIEEFVATYAPFEAETAAGVLSFQGQGSTEATETERRQIAEWARLTAVEASTGRQSVELGLAMLWRREGGVAGFCDDLLIYSTGQVRSYTCGGETIEPTGQGRLTTDELALLYEWLDTFPQTMVEQTDDAEADAMTLQMLLVGRNPQAEQATEEQQQEMMAFAQEQFDSVEPVEPSQEATGEATEEADDGG